MYDLSDPTFEFLRPLTQAWVNKLEQAERARKDWKEIADECMMFYSKSAAAMWNPSYERKFWRSVEAPRFRITINKAFELVAVFGPNLLWEVPHRSVESKRRMEIPPEIFQLDQQAGMMQQQLQQMQAMNLAQAKVTSYLMEDWLNYTPREQPGGLMKHSELAVVDALIKGRGVMAVRTYKPPTSNRVLTGSFREPPENLLTDPDYTDIQDCKWIALKHVDPHWEVERRFKLKPGSLQNRASLESSWSWGEASTTDKVDGMWRADGKTNDLIVWYEIWSKTGPGTRMTGVQSVIKDHLERTVGDYAYLAVSANIPWPLNCPSQKMREGATDADVREKFSWPVPTWADDRWPIEVLDFYPDPDSAWPIPPLAPAMGELKFLNFLIPWLANRIYSSSRDIWAVAGPHHDEFAKFMKSAADQDIFNMPVGTDDIRKIVQSLQQPETRMDAWRIVELVSELFDKRTGLTAMAYGQNEGGTQNRSAEETAAKARAVGVRPEHMQKKVVAWQSEMATVEAFLTRWFVRGEDVEPRMGPVGRWLWERYVMSTDVELVVRQMDYTVGAASIRRPNRDRDVGNFQQVMQYWVQPAFEYGQHTSNFQPYNYLMKKWADFHDADLDGAMFPPPQPDPQQQQMQQQQAQLEQQKMQLEMAKIQADLQGKQIDSQAKMTDAQLKQQQAQAALMQKQQGLQLKGAGERQAIAFDARRHEQDMMQDATSNLLDMLQKRQQFAQDMAQQKAMGEQKLQLARQQARAKPKATNGKR